jgi:pantothenate kinase type III
MIIVFDIGNSEIDFALFAALGKEPKYHGSIKSGTAKFDRDLLSFLKQNKIRVGQITNVVIGSVVPIESKRIARICQSIFNGKPFIAVPGKNTLIQ